MGQSAVKSLTRGILLILTLLLAATTILASLAGRYHPSESTFMPLLGLALPFLLLANALVLVVFLLMRKVQSLIPLLAILANWSYLTTIIQFNNHPIIVANAPTLTVANYNVHSFGHEFTGYSCKELARYLEEQQVDVVCFQEFGGNQAFTTDSILSAFSHWPHRYIPQADGHLQVALFSLHPLSHQEHLLFPETANSSMMVHVEAPGGTVTLFNCHLQTTSISQRRTTWSREMDYGDTRQKIQTTQEAAETLHGNLVKRAFQVDSLCQRIRQSEHPVVLCGDLNSMPSSYTYRTFSTLLTDAFQEAGSGYMYTFRYAWRLLRIDYSFHSSRLRAIECFSPRQELCSDHNPVVTRYQYNPIPEEALLDSALPIAQ